MWLRQRDKAWELKVPLSTWRREKNKGPSSIDQYKELEGEGDILSFLFDRTLLSRPGLPSSLEQSLRSDGFAEFAKITTHRVIYECEGLTVTFDTATPLNYSVGELELLVAASSDVGKAEERIRSFAKSYGLSIDSRMPGKVLEHIRRNAPLHWKALRESGHLKSKNVHEY